MIKYLTITHLLMLFVAGFLFAKSTLETGEYISFIPMLNCTTACIALFGLVLNSKIISNVRTEN